MKNRILLIGTVKQCKNVYCYETYGDQKYFPDFELGNVEFGTVQRYTDITEENAILIKISDKKYIWLVRKDNKLIDIVVISSYPKKNNDLFVDTKTLEQYTKKSKDKTIKKTKHL